MSVYLIDPSSPWLIVKDLFILGEYFMKCLVLNIAATNDNNNRSARFAG
jgi:hypothetical protein